MKTKFIITAVLFGIVLTSAGQEPKENDFFVDGISLVDTIVNLATDYGANGNDMLDDSPALQQAVDFVTRFPNGGRINIPAGTYHLIGITMKDNVHIVIDSTVTIVAANPTGVIFSFGLGSKGTDALVTVRNASIRGNGGSYKVDLRKGEINEKLSFANCRNINNFMIADFYIFDHYTKMAGVTLNLAEEGNMAFCANNGVVKNGDIENAHVGYGLIQVQCAKHILFKNLKGQGGVTLRMESGAVAESPAYIMIDDIWARDIETREGSSAFIMGSHTKINGYVNIDRVRGYGSGSVGSVGRGFVTADEAAAGLVPGYFSPNCVIKNVHGVFGLKAQVKWKNLDMIPCQLRHLIPAEKAPDNECYIAPSFGVFGWNDTEITNISNITGEGYDYGKIVYSVNDEIANCSTVDVTDVKNNKTIYPNPAHDYLQIVGHSGTTVKLLDNNGVVLQTVKAADFEKIDVSRYVPGIYLIHISGNEGSECKKIIIQ